MPRGSCDEILAKKRKLGHGKGREVVLLWGQVGSAVASIELLYEDGERETITPVEGFVLHDILMRHWRAGHRLEAMVGRDADGDV